MIYLSPFTLYSIGDSKDSVLTVIPSEELGLHMKSLVELVRAKATKNREENFRNLTLDSPRCPGT